MREGLIQVYAWSTDDPDDAVFAQGAHCAAVQHRLNILQDAPELRALCKEFNLASINRSPLASGRPREGAAHRGPGGRDRPDPGAVSGPYDSH